MPRFSSVPPSAKIVPHPASRFFDPRTERGVSLRSVAVPVVHECGLMTLDAGWNHPHVCSPFWRAYVNLDAGAAVTVAGRRLPLRPGWALIIPEEVAYSCRPRVGVRHLWIHFSWPEGGRLPSPQEVRLASHRLEEWKTLAARLQDGDRDLSALCTALLLQLLPGLSAALSPRPSARWLEFLQWAELRLAHPPSIDEMAAFQKMSGRAFHRWFVETAEISPGAWFLRRRIREACRLLRYGNASIEEIAEATGFAHRHHFTRAFRAQTGTTPAAYRTS